MKHIGETWALGCQGCGAQFTVPVHRGRPPLYCDECAAGRPVSWRPRRIRDAIARQMEMDRQRQNLGKMAALGPMEILELQRRRAEGWTTEQLASIYGVSTRTVGRYLPRKLVRIAVGGWFAWFSQRRMGKSTAPGPPLQVTPWRHVAAETPEEKAVADR